MDSHPGPVRPLCGHLSKSELSTYLLTLCTSSGRGLLSIRRVLVGQALVLSSCGGRQDASFARGRMAGGFHIKPRAASKLVRRGRPSGGGQRGDRDRTAVPSLSRHMASTCRLLTAPRLCHRVACPPHDVLGHLYSKVFHETSATQFGHVLVHARAFGSPWWGPSSSRRAFGRRIGFS